MRLVALFSAGLAVLPYAVSAQKSVFAHIVVGNTAAHSVTTWGTDISLAQAAGIDAFVLNIGLGDTNTPGQVANAFSAAEAAGSTFKLFFAFDYLGGPSGAWPATGDFPNSVVSFVNKYKTSPAYFKFNNLPFVSTFEGTGNVNDWAQGGPIRSGTGGVYFVPDWTSLGPGGITGVSDKIDGAFNFDMWPEGAHNKTADVDKAWQGALGQKSYMMGVSPWFFHSATGFGPNWLWRGDDLWADSWAQTLDVNPQFVQIVTWNDYAEATYIGPLHDPSEIAAGSGQYVNNMPHDSWRDFLPYYIGKFKNSPPAIDRDQMQFWYRLAPASAGSTCGVTANNPNQGQQALPPDAVLQDGVFFSALLKADAKVTVQIGSGPLVSFDGKQGINHWSTPFNGNTGAPVFSIVRDGVTVNSGKGAAIEANTNLPSGCANYNAWVGSF
ncbi:uncharacterized protein BP5553_06205 [Venustampulla echinocandica]|uniref:Glucan endo-1,3-alpha-glucosidase agn1 n=1 Tax=Venustampulla echinocandica TaxID=2656787 RepID=A0A370TMT7_9HELO|nr:uncharacterized protein BP5553_06205 [Venustampulla echinocandica]RDL36853.1 hypothetical protein BP5553_06205 [Venustampulla echinocandica]